MRTRRPFWQAVRFPRVSKVVSVILVIGICINSAAWNTAFAKKLVTLLDLCVSSLRRGHANLLCIVPILTDDPRRESNDWFSPGSERLRPAAVARGATNTKTLAFTCTHFRYLCPSALYINQRLALPQQPNLYLEPKWLRYPSILCITRPAAEQRTLVAKGHPSVEILEWSLFAKGLALKG